VDIFLFRIVGLAVVFADKGYLVKSPVAVNYTGILIGVSDDYIV
jgi:hypothetical protein